MSLTPCRDCKTPLPPEARGCPRCARNLSAERALGRLLRIALVVAAVALASAVWLYARAAR